MTCTNCGKRIVNAAMGDLDGLCDRCWEERDGNTYSEYSDPDNPYGDPPEDTDSLQDHGDMPSYAS